MSKTIYKTIQSRINHKDDLYKDGDERNNFIEYKVKNLELLVTDCSLKIINITINEKIYLYYKIPKELFHTILTRNDNLQIIKSIQKNFNEIINNENEINILEKEEIMMEKAEQDGINKTGKKYAFRSLKSKPNKTLNRMKTQSTKIRTENSNMLRNGNLRTFTKKFITLRKNKNEENNSDNRKIKINRFLESKDDIKEVNENYEKLNDYNNNDESHPILRKNINEDIKENFSDINSGEKLKKFKFSRKFTIDFRKKNA